MDNFIGIHRAIYYDIINRVKTQPARQYDLLACWRREATAQFCQRRMRVYACVKLQLIPFSRFTVTVKYCGQSIAYLCFRTSNDCVRHWRRLCSTLRNERMIRVLAWRVLGPCAGRRWGMGSPPSHHGAQGVLPPGKFWYFSKEIRPFHAYLHDIGLAVWCSGNALVSINAVALHRARLVLGWVTAFGQVNCLIT